MKVAATASIIEFTPADAAEWLRNPWPGQRNLREAHVLRIISDMENGRWKLSPDAICRVKGYLANGQHRLQAVVRSGKPQSFVVLESNDDELYKSIDAGIRRTVSDAIKQPFVVPAIGRWVWAYEHASLAPSNAGPGMATRTSIATSPNTTRRTTVAPSQSEMIEFCQDRLDDLVEAVSFVRPLYDRTHLLPISMGGAFHVIGHAKRGLGEKTDDFLNCLYVTGGANAAGDFRNRLIKEQRSRSRIAQGYKFILGLKCMSAFHKGQRPGLIKVGDNEPLPEI